jgi:hypothetical protein
MFVSWHKEYGTIIDPPPPLPKKREKNFNENDHYDHLLFVLETKTLTLNIPYNLSRQ